MEKYYALDSPYNNRLDFIYNSNRERNQNNKIFHSQDKTTQHTQDWSGGFALISDCFAYWGKECKKIPQEILNFLPTAQGHYIYDVDTDVRGKQILSFVETLWNFKDNIQKEPNDLHDGCSSNKCKMIPNQFKNISC
jgi:hypothetical protein